MHYIQVLFVEKINFFCQGTIRILFKY